MLVNGNSLSALNTGFKDIFTSAFAEEKPLYEKIAMTVPSTTSSNTYGWLGRIPGMREWIDDRVLENLEASTYSIKNRRFEYTVTVSRTDIEDDNLGIYNPLFAELGRAAHIHPDKLSFSLIQNGFSTTCYDGQYFFDTDHPVNGSLVSNNGGGTGTAWYLFCTKRPVKPIIFQSRQEPRFLTLEDPQNPHVFMKDEYVYGVDYRCNVGYGLWQLAYASKQPLDAAAYANARSAMMSFTDNHGSPLGIVPDMMVVPPSLEEAAKTILNNERAASGASNPWKNSAELLVSPWLA